MPFTKLKTTPNFFHLIIVGFLTCVISSLGFSQVPVVEYHGALKNMMHKGDISAKVDLAVLQKKDHIYALGALENLNGEIQIFNGKPYNTLVQDKTLAFDQSYTKKATLLVYASVREWNTIVIPNDIDNYEQLEVFIKQEAIKNQIDANAPFLIRKAFCDSERLDLLREADYLVTQMLKENSLMQKIFQLLVILLPISKNGKEAVVLMQ